MALNSENEDFIKAKKIKHKKIPTNILDNDMENNENKWLLIPIMQIRNCILNKLREKG